MNSASAAVTGDDEALGGFRGISDSPAKAQELICGNTFAPKGRLMQMSCTQQQQQAAKRRSCSRIKLSRELMVRLSAALANGCSSQPATATINTTFPGERTEPSQSGAARALQRQAEARGEASNLANSAGNRLALISCSSGAERSERRPALVADATSMRTPLNCDDDDNNTNANDYYGNIMKHCEATRGCRSEPSAGIQGAERRGTSLRRGKRISFLEEKLQRQRRLILARSKLFAEPTIGALHSRKLGARATFVVSRHDSAQIWRRLLTCWRRSRTRRTSMCAAMPTCNKRQERRKDRRRIIRGESRQFRQECLSRDNSLEQDAGGPELGCLAQPSGDGDPGASLERGRQLAGDGSAAAVGVSRKIHGREKRGNKRGKRRKLREIRTSESSILPRETRRKIKSSRSKSVTSNSSKTSVILRALNSGQVAPSAATLSLASISLAHQLCNAQERFGCVAQSGAAQEEGLTEAEATGTTGRQRRRRSRQADWAPSCADASVTVERRPENDNCHKDERASGKPQARVWRASLWRWLLLLAVCLLFEHLWLARPVRLCPEVGAVQQPSEDQSAAAPNTSDELSRAILATMSTQSPPLERDNGSSQARAGPEPAPSGAETGEGQWPSAGQSDGEPATVQQASWLDKLLDFVRIFVMGAIIVGDICGNSLVILSVCRHSKLRVTTNWFVVSLACADILVALFAMTFNASVIISGRWLFKPWVCDFWNSCDVLASTASILHLCCISIDRYIAIMRPLDYPMKITTRRVIYALCGVWISSALLSYIPIFTGIYTTAEHIKWLSDNPDQCEFVVNRVYAVVSSSISFWIPCCIMVFTYYRIYREATRQEKFIYKAQSMMPAPMANHKHHSGSGNHHHNGHSKQRRSKSVAVSSASGSANQSERARIRQLAQQHSKQLGGKQQRPLHGPTQIATTNLNDAAIPAIAGAQAEVGAQSQGPNKNPQSGSAQVSPKQEDNDLLPLPPPQITTTSAALDEEQQDEQESNSGQSTPTKRSISKMKREHKAAKTLGIIMGVFILCWLPFFSWYTPQHICGHACDGMVPRGAVTILFWIGYFNSTLNPIIYAYFNHEFRDAFKKTLQWIFCCCQDLKCLRVNRPSDSQHYNCTYRSTQEIGLVSNS